MPEINVKVAASSGEIMVLKDCDYRIDYMVDAKVTNGAVPNAVVRVYVQCNGDSTDAVSAPSAVKKVLPNNAVTDQTFTKSFIASLHKGDTLSLAMKRWGDDATVAVEQAALTVTQIGNCR